MTVAMVLAAGLGTRLRPLTEHVPKPLCPVGDRPQIDHILRALAEAGIARAVVNTHHLHEQFTEAWARSQPLEVVRVHEPDILGTGGGVANARRALGDGPVLVWNADILASFNVAELVSFAGDHVTLVVGPHRGAGEGTAGLSDQGVVARLRAARSGVETRSADYAGIAVLPRVALDRLTAPSCLVGDLFVPMMAAGEELRTFELPAPFTDTGSLAEYLGANLAWLGGRPLHAEEGVVIGPGIELRRSIVGRGARLEGRGVVRDTVVWPNATARAPLERAIVTPFGVVHI